MPKKTRTPTITRALTATGNVEDLEAVCGRQFLDFTVSRCLIPTRKGRHTRCNAYVLARHVETDKDGTWTRDRAIPVWWEG